MLDSELVFRELRKRSITFFTGVPDSLLKDFCAYVTDHTADREHVIAANEGGAVALAAGHFLATGKAALVYMQNSGFGNAVNPLLSLADPEVYSIPMLLMVGWRGEPGRADEPQHRKQGRVIERLLDALEIPYAVLGADVADIGAVIDEAIATMLRAESPFVLLVRAGTFAPYSLKTDVTSAYPLDREQAIRLIADGVPPDSIIVSTTGKGSRELFEYRETRGGGHQRDFLTVGSMGHCSQIAMGIALRKPHVPIYCLDGDGSLIMHMGGVAIIGSRAPTNLRHIVINNGAHDSVGGQPTAGFAIDLPELAAACGYRIVSSAKTPDEIVAGLERLSSSDGPGLLEIRVRKGARHNLGRPTTRPIDNRKGLMTVLASEP